VPLTVTAMVPFAGCDTAPFEGSRLLAATVSEKSAELPGGGTSSRVERFHDLMSTEVDPVAAVKLSVPERRVAPTGTAPMTIESNCSSESPSTAMTAPVSVPSTAIAVPALPVRDFRPRTGMSAIATTGRFTTRGVDEKKPSWAVTVTVPAPLALGWARTVTWRVHSSMMVMSPGRMV
jgi:hypothetical protein